MRKVPTKERSMTENAERTRPHREAPELRIKAGSTSVIKKGGGDKKLNDH